MIIDHIQFNNISASGQKAIDDSRCTYHFLCDITQYEEVQPTGHKAIEVTPPNGQKIKSTHIAVLKWKHLPTVDRTFHIFTQLNNKILLSIGKFYDVGLLAALTATTLYVYNTIMVYLRGEIKTVSGIWYVDLYQQDPTPITE